jgi:hypothetical protein
MHCFTNRLYRADFTSLIYELIYRFDCEPDLRTGFAGRTHRLNSQAPARQTAKFATALPKARKSGCHPAKDRLQWQMN